jgi:zinc protease
MKREFAVVPDLVPEEFLMLTAFRPLPAFLLGIAVLLAPATPAPADDLALRTAAALYEGIRTETLPNGLRVFLKPIPGSPDVTTFVTYKVGSGDEDKNFTGLSHYLEHLMFKGTDTLVPGDIDRITFRNGGANNAYTNTDETAYHFTFPADRWLPALKIEADRMRHLRIDEKHEFEKEKGAVINELMRNEDTPWDLEQKAILPFVFGKKAPYGHPVIGESEHVRAASAKVIKDHYDRWYHPNNAVIVIVGGFDPDAAMAEIRKLFGPIPAGKLPERKTIPDEKLKRPARIEMKSKFPMPRLMLGYNTVKAGDPDVVPLAVLEAVLSLGRTSRLYKALVEGAEVATSTDASHSPGRFGGWLAVSVEVLPDKDRKKVEELALKELQRLRDEPLQPAELARVKRLLVARTIFGLESVRDLADNIATAATITDLEYQKNYLPKIQAVTAAEVQRVAKKYLDPESRVTLWSVRPEGLREPGKEKGASLAHPVHRGVARTLEREPVGARAFDLKKTQRVVLPNGLVLLLFENHRLPIVEVRASVRNVHLVEPASKVGVATLMGALLDEGTAKRTGPQIAELIENTGGLLSLSSSGGGARILTPDRSLGLELLLDCLMNPAFPKEAFARVQAQQLSRIEEAETTPDTRAAQTFSAVLYGKHPLGRPSLGTMGSVKPLTPDDCKAFHRREFVPNNTTLAIVGDFDSKAIVAEITKLTADWKKADLGKPELPAVTMPKEFSEKILTMPEAAQLHFYMGHLGVRRTDPDYYKLLVMDYVLGVGPGFTDRLSSRLRDREGLAYTVTASITRSASTEPGLFTCYIGTDNNNYARVKKEFLEEVNRIRDEVPGDKEVEDARTYLIGSHLLEFAGNGNIATQLLAIERYKLGFDYLEDFRKAVQAVTPEDVREMARKHLHPGKMAVVAAGAVDAKGEPLKKVK